MDLKWKLFFKRRRELQNILKIYGFNKNRIFFLFHIFTVKLTFCQRIDMMFKYIIIRHANFWKNRKFVYSTHQRRTQQQQKKWIGRKSCLVPETIHSNNNNKQQINDACMLCLEMFRTFFTFYSFSIIFNVTHHFLVTIELLYSPTEFFSFFLLNKNIIFFCPFHSHYISKML